MKKPSLQLTFRDGKPLVGYLRLPRPAGTKAVRTAPARPGILVDYAADGTAIGLELLTPNAETGDVLNEVLVALGLAPLPEQDLAPLRVA